MARSKRKDRLEKLKRIADDAAAAPNEKEVAQAEIKRLVTEAKSEPREPGEPPPEVPQNLPLWAYGLTAGQPEPTKSRSAALPGFMPGPKKPKGLPKKS